MNQYGLHGEPRIVDNPFFQKAAAPAPRPSVEERFITSTLHAAEQLVREGVPVTALTVRERNQELPFGKVAELFASPRFQEMLAQRGIPLPSETGLTPEQLHALAIYMDMSIPANHAQRLRLAGVTEGRWRMWKRQRAFADELTALSEEALRDSQPVALQRIASAVDDGHRWAIEMSLEMTGRHDRRKESIDVGALMMEVFSILDEEVPDTAVLARVASRIKARLGAGAGQVLQIAPSVRGSLDDLEPEQEGG